MATLTIHKAWYAERTDEALAQFESDLEDLELSRNAQFVAAMTHLIEGIDSGAIDVSQWQRL